MKVRKFLAWMLGLTTFIVGCTADDSFEPADTEVTPPIEENVIGEVLDGNSIEVTSFIPGTYTLIYEKGSGQTMVNFSSICTLSLESLARYEDFIDVNIAPRGAEAIGIYDAYGERQGAIQLSTLSNDSSEAPIYSVGVLSDVHLGRSAIYPDTDFIDALAFFKAKGAIMTCICGDISQNGAEEEFSLFKEITSQADIPVYTVTGNHDCTSSGDHIDTALWTQYTGFPLVFEKSVEINGKVDHFLFLGMSRWKFSSTIYLESSLLWLEDKLEEYRNERCFIFTHPFFPDRAGNLNEIYPSGNWLKGTQLATLQDLCDSYPNTLWFSGHSHWEWKLQTYQDRANIYTTKTDSERSSGWCVHIPSCGVPITSDGTTRVDNVHGSEGAVIEVHENYVEVLGVDFKRGQYLPIATYRLDTTPQVVEEKQKHYLSAKDFMENPSKTGCVVADIEDMPNYVEVTFTAKGQGFYVANDTYFTDATAVKIIVEDVQAFSNGEPIDIPENVGFYGNSTYFLTSTYSAGITHNSSYWGVQFQTSKSKYGDAPLPLTLRMKAQMIFH
ncbi:MAG: metallophosphoesterase [Alistipes sp.]|nr:metallophosphoesterase [Alistipes sp.]